MSTIFQLFSSVFVWVSIYKENHNDYVGAILMMMWALWTILTAIYIKMEEK